MATGSNEGERLRQGFAGCRGDRGAQHNPCATEPRFQGGFRDSQDPGRLGDRQPLDLAEDERDPVPRREPADGRFEETHVGIGEEDG